MSCCRDEELKQQKRVNASIERQLKIEQKTFREPQRDKAKQQELISLVKQVFPLTEMSEQQRVLRIPEIVYNIMDIVMSLLVSLKQSNFPNESADTIEKLDQIAQQLSRTREDIPSDVLLELSQLCTDANVQSHLESTSSRAAYFLSPRNLRKIAEPHYVPSVEDIVNCKERSSSIVEIKTPKNLVYCQIPKLPWSSKVYRHLGMADCHSMIVYIVDCGGFIEVQSQGSMTTKLTDALDEYEMMWKCGWPSGTAILLILSGKDTLREKIMLGRIRLEHYFPEFSSYSGDHERVLHFIQEKFLSITGHDFHTTVYCHFTEAVDQSIFEFIKSATLETILTQFFSKQDLL